MKMKKLVVIFVLLATAFVCAAGNGRKEKEAMNAVPVDRLVSLISDYSAKDGFDVIRIGRLGTSAIKSLARLGSWDDGDSDAEEALSIISGIKKLAIVDYEDCSPADKESFERKVGRLLKDENVIMEFKDDGHICRIYGVMDERSDKLRDFVLYTPSDCALICLFGSISLSKVTSVMDL